MAEQPSDRFIEITGGLTSRLEVLGSIIENGYNNNFKLVWEPQPGCYCKFNDIFKNDFNFIDRNTIDFSNFIIQTYGSCFSEYHYYPFLSTLKCINEYPCGIIFDNSNYILMDYTVGWDFTQEYIIKLVKILILQDDIQSLLDGYINQFNNDTIGVYYRGCEETVNYSSSCNIDILSYIPLIENILNTSSSNIFICSGSQEFINLIKDRFNNQRLIFVEEFCLDSAYSVEGTKRAMLDWLLLSKTKLVYGVGGGYCFKACKLGGIEHRRI